MEPYKYRSNFICIDTTNQIYEAYILRVGKINPYTNICYQASVINKALNEYLVKIYDHTAYGGIVDTDMLINNKITDASHKIVDMNISGNKLYVGIKLLNNHLGSIIKSLYDNDITLVPILSMSVVDNFKVNTINFPKDITIDSVNIGIETQNAH